MLLTPGTRLGSYEILSLIGAGGMGEVYEARDTKLGREVAIKVLPEAFAQDKERLARFEREARLLASLNHPNIATIHDFEESDGVHFLVLEFVPGETLAEWIKRGPIPVDEAMLLFKQIADGLEAAHEKGVIHRDLKPANIKVTPDGKAKVLDFGLAKAIAGEVPNQSLSESPTMTRGATEAGILLGTAPYMSPEQARGKAVDKRADIWAFGCCLYEALVGKTAFLGETVTDTLAKIVERQPNWEALPANTPALVRGLLRRCLHKDTTRRFHDIADVRIEIEEAAIEPGAVGDIRTGESTRPRGRRALSWTLAALAAVAVGITVLYLKPATPRPIMKMLVGVQPAEWLGTDVVVSYEGSYALSGHRSSRTAMALSPDGKHLIYSAGDNAGSRLYLRRMDELEARLIPGTEGGEGPFLSPDGQWLGFWADGTLKKVRIDGGPATVLCDAGRTFGASWGVSDTIVFGQIQGGILRISADGGTPEAITTLAEGEFSHRLPELLPDGKTVLFTVTKGSFGPWDEATVVAQSMETGEQKVLIENGTDARYAPTGHLVFVRLGTLMAVPFDPKRLEIMGGEVTVVDGVQHSVNVSNSYEDTGAGQFGFSASGSLVYVPGGIFPDPEQILVWVDREGVTEPLRATAGAGLYWWPRLSPDGRRVALAKASELEEDIWLYDILRETSTRLTVEKGVDSQPVWTPDGARITFRSQRSGGRRHIYWMPADGSGAVERLTTIDGSSPASWSPDGKILAFLLRQPDSDYDIWMLPLDGEPVPFIQSPFQERWPAFSPDGQWLAYASNQSGRYEVYVTPYPGPGPKYQISTDGGTSTAWRRNGRELFYRSLRDSEGLHSMMAVDITTVPTFTTGKPRELFRDDSRWSNPLRNYDVTSDGQRFLMVRRVSRPPETVTELRVTLNWFEELKRLAPTGN